MSCVPDGGRSAVLLAALDTLDCAAATFAYLLPVLVAVDRLSQNFSRFYGVLF